MTPCCWLRGTRATSAKRQVVQIGWPGLSHPAQRVSKIMTRLEQMGVTELFDAAGTRAREAGDLGVCGCGWSGGGCEFDVVSELFELHDEMLRRRAGWSCPSGYVSIRVCRPTRCCQDRSCGAADLGATVAMSGRSRTHGSLIGRFTRDGTPRSDPRSGLEELLT